MVTLRPRGRTVILESEVDPEFGTVVKVGHCVKKRKFQMSESKKKRNVHLTEFKAKVGLEAAAGSAYGFNAATLQFGNLMDMGVIDPAKVTRLALQNAASVAAMILTTDCMIAAGPPPHTAQPPEMAPDLQHSDF